MASEWTKGQDQVQGRKRSRLSVKDFDGLVTKNFPSWNAVWSLLLEANREKRKANWGEGTSGVKHQKKKTPSDLQKRIRHKITELVDEEEVLAGLYAKAAQAAKEREEELRDKSAILMKQIEKDKNFMRTLKNMSY